MVGVFAWIVFEVIQKIDPRTRNLTNKCDYLTTPPTGLEALAYKRFCMRPA